MRESNNRNEGHRKRLRDRFMKSGLEGFADYEVVELLLTLAIPRSDVKGIAKDLISRFKNLAGILDAPVEEISKIDGVGNVTPVALKIIKDAATLYLQQCAESQDIRKDENNLRNSLIMRIGSLKNEVFEIAYLDSNYQVQNEGFERLEEGVIDRAAIYPRKVIESALKRNAYSIVIAHNHPNGDGSPSEQDKLITRAIALAAETVNLRIYDHFIVTVTSCFSFRQAGLL